MKTWDLFAGKHGDLIGILVGIIIKNINDVQFFPKMGVRLGLDLERHQIDVGAFKIQDPKFSQCIISEVLAVQGGRRRSTNECCLCLEDYGDEAASDTYPLAIKHG